MNASLARARRLEATHGVRTYEVLDENLALFVAGVWRPKLLVSSGAMALLDAGEIRAALQHELAHVKRGDNLKKLVLRFCALPGLGSLEREWLKATEEEADDTAARDEGTALDLASALIKMTRASSLRGAPPLGMALVPENGASVSARVERLLAAERPAGKNHRVLAWAILASAALAVSLNYAWVLVQMHEITEALLR
jgi:Zn-dependent protease with chaperone function